MKHLLFTVLIISCISSYSQNTELFQTWYLYSSRTADTEPIFNVSEIEPAITPSLTISENHEFVGTGACNTFSGKFDISATMVKSLDFSQTDEVCTVQDYTSLEESFFGFLQGEVYYEISYVNNKPKLILATNIFGEAKFTNSPLALNKLDPEQIKIHPNPCTSFLFINTSEVVINQITIYNIYGQSVKTIDTNFEKINISELSSGLYFVKVHSGYSISTQKVIKKQ